MEYTAAYQTRPLSLCNTAVFPAPLTLFIAVHPAALQPIAALRSSTRYRTAAASASPADRARIYSLAAKIEPAWAAKAWRSATYQTTEIRRASLRQARDPQLLHLVGERRPLEAQASCRSTSTSDNPIAFAERSHNLLSLGLLQRIVPANRAEA